MRLFILTALVFALNGVGGVKASTWTAVPLPAGTEYLSELSAGYWGVYAGIHDSSGVDQGLFTRRLDIPNEWRLIGFAGVKVRKVFVCGDSDQRLFAWTSGTPSLWYSEDAGASWVGRDLPDYGSHTWIRCIQTNGGDPPVLYVSAMHETDLWHRIYVSSDFGQTWDHWSACENCLAVGYMLIDTPLDRGLRARSILYTGSWDLEPYETTNGGLTWSLYWDHPLLELVPIALAHDPLRFDEFHLLATTYLNWWDVSFKGSFLTPFTSMRGNIGMIAPQWMNDSLFVAGVPGGGNPPTPGPPGVYRANDPAGNWIWAGDGLPLEPCRNPMENWDKFHFCGMESTQKLLFSIWGQGLWMLDTRNPASVGTSPNSGGRTGSVQLLGPNPSTATFDFVLSEGSENRGICIYDVRGHLVRRISDRSSIVHWDGRSIDRRRCAPGTYFAALPGSTSFTKLVLTR